MPYRVDDWDELVEVEDKSNWEEWDLWRAWCDSHLYEYEDIDVADLESHDTIIFRDLIFGKEEEGRGKRRKFKKWVYLGERLHIAEWVKNRDGFMYLISLYTIGDAPIKPGTKTKRRIQNAAKYGLKRFPLGQRPDFGLPHDPAVNSEEGFKKSVASRPISGPRIPKVSRFQQQPKPGKGGKKKK